MAEFGGLASNQALEENVERHWESVSHRVPGSTGDCAEVPVDSMSAQMASRLAMAELTYPEVGATKGALPPGYHHLRRSRVIGSGGEAFAARPPHPAACHPPLSRRSSRSPR